MLKNPSPLNVLVNRTGELRGERLEDWLNKCNYTHFPLSEHKHLQCVTLCFILVWINLLCLTILIGYFSQKNWTCGLLHTRESCLSAWNLMSAIFVEKDDLLKWQCQKKILFCLPKQSYCTCCPRGLEADDRVDAQLTDFSWVWFKVIFFNHLHHACSHTQSTADSTRTHTHTQTRTPVYIMAFYRQQFTIHCSG